MIVPLIHCAIFFFRPPPLLSTDNFPEIKHTSINWSLYTPFGVFIIFRGYNNEMPSNYEPSASPPGSCINNRSTDPSHFQIPRPILSLQRQNPQSLQVHCPPLLNLNPGHCKSHLHYYQPFINKADFLENFTFRIFLKRINQ